MRHRIVEAPVRAIIVVAWLAAMAGVAVLAIGVILNALPTPATVQCDGFVPTWMTEAQDYDGGGCLTVLPTDHAPENADWTPYCLGMC